MKYGLIGEKLGHSFSKTIHNFLGNDEYELLELDKKALSIFLKEKNFIGINVTIPYKQEVIKYLDYIDTDAKEINAVNTIINDNGVLKGYNTDFLGLKINIDNNNIVLKNKIIAILGNGGTSKTALQVSKKLLAKKIFIVTRNTITNINNYDNVEYINYDELLTKHIDVIINTTPCGMFPNIDECPIDIFKFNNLYAVIDVIYNPLKTNLIINAKNNSIKYATGLYMLVAQAVYANNLFFNNINNNNIVNLIDKCYKKVYNDKINYVFIGMPGCGKSTISNEISKICNKKFIDLDIEFEKLYNITPSECINQHGENKFRDLEENLVKQFSSVNNAVISTGGGVVLRENNINNLKKNGIIYFIDRDINLIEATNDRPLSSNKQLLKKRYDERIDLYKKYADVIINNNNSLSDFIVKFKNEQNY